MRDNPPVTQTEHRNKVYSSDHFYKETLTLSENSCLVDSSGQVLARLLSNIVPERLVQQLEQVSEKYKKHLKALCEISDNRGAHVTIKFGSYLERGGKGRMFVKKNPPNCLDFLEEVKEVGEFISYVYNMVCVEVASVIQQYLPMTCQV